MVDHLSGRFVLYHFDVASAGRETRFSRSLRRPFVDSCAAHLLCRFSPLGHDEDEAAPLKDAKGGRDRRRRYLAILTLFGVLSNKLGRRTGVLPLG